MIYYKSFKFKYRRDKFVLDETLMFTNDISLHALSCFAFYYPIFFNINVFSFLARDRHFNGERFNMITSIRRVFKFCTPRDLYQLTVFLEGDPNTKLLETRFVCRTPTPPFRLRIFSQRSTLISSSVNTGTGQISVFTIISTFLPIIYESLQKIG